MKAADTCPAAIPDSTLFAGYADLKQRRKSRYRSPQNAAEIPSRLTLPPDANNCLGFLYAGKVPA